jgi:hypothetical protein
MAWKVELDPATVWDLDRFDKQTAVVIVNSIIGMSSLRLLFSAYPILYRSVPSD